MSHCDHKFVDSTVCLKCGVSFEHLKRHREFPREVPKPPAAPELPEGEGVWFCVPCEDANVTRSDADRCCLMCGTDLTSLAVLRALLATQGLSIVDAKDRAPEPTLDSVMDNMMKLARAAGFVAHVKLSRPRKKKFAEMARREGKP